MTTLGDCNTDVSDMYAIHKALTGALDAAPAYVAKARLDSERVEVIGSFYENVIEFLHAHHTGEDELIYPVLEQRCAESRSELERIDNQHKFFHAPIDAARSAIDNWRAAPSTPAATTHARGRRHYPASSGMRRVSSAKPSPVAWWMSGMDGAKTSHGMSICKARVKFSRSSSPSSGYIHAVNSGTRLPGMVEDMVLTALT
ncbi:MAG: hemerythrin domain-containing protein [Actinobacteria bacterium]|nr:MAG: hemerythrin domain-containing protein [Actinomycetota bacterium]